MTEEAMELADIPKDFSSRYLNDGFSGGEKKRMEILQLALLRPRFAVLDETDSGLDIDALRVVADGVNRFSGPDMGVLIITHYQRILHYVKPDFVHVMFEGRIVKEGGPSSSRPSRRRATAGSGRKSRRRRERLSRDLRRSRRRRSRGFPGARARGQRRPGRLPGLRRQRPARPRLDPGGGPLRAPPPLERPPRLAHPLGRGDGRLRGRPRDRGRPHRRRRPPRGDLRSQRHRGDQPRRPGLGRRQRRRGRSHRAHGDGAPLQHRPLAAARRTGRRRDRLGAGHRRRTPRHGRACEPRSGTGPSWLRVAHVSNVLGTLNPIAEIAAHGARRRRARPRRRRPGRAQARARHGRARRRLLRDHRPQALRAHGHRRALGAGSTCCARRRRSWAAAR